MWEASQVCLATSAGCGPAGPLESKQAQSLAGAKCVFRAAPAPKHGSPCSGTVALESPGWIPSDPLELLDPGQLHSPLSPWLLVWR